MMDKRMRKMTTYLHRDARPPQVYGGAGREVTLVGWGSSKPALLEAQQRLKTQGMPVTVLHFTHLWPFPAHLAKSLLNSGKPVVVCEHNYLGQLADIIQAHSLIPVRRVLKYNGRPFYPSEVVRAVREVTHNGATAVRLGGKEPVMVEVSTDA